MKNMRVKDLGITERRKGFKNDSPKPRVSAAYRLPTETKLKLVEIANALGSSETAAFVEIVNNYYENQEEIRRAVQFEKLKKEREALKERLAKINNEIGSLGSWFFLKKVKLMLAIFWDYAILFSVMRDEKQIKEAAKKVWKNYSVMTLNGNTYFINEDPKHRRRQLSGYYGKNPK